MVIKQKLKNIKYFWLKNIDLRNGSSKKIKPKLFTNKLHDRKSNYKQKKYLL